MDHGRLFYFSLGYGHRQNEIHLNLEVKGVGQRISLIHCKEITPSYVSEILRTSTST